VPKIAIQQLRVRFTALGAWEQGWVNMVFYAINTFPCIGTFLLLPLPMAHMMAEALFF